MWPRFSLERSEHDGPDHEGRKCHAAQNDHKCAHRPMRKPSPQHTAAQKRGCDLDRTNKSAMMVWIPVADWALEDPIRERPEMRASIIVVKQKIQPQMQKGRGTERNDDRRTKQGCKPQTHAPENDRVIDAEN